MNVPVLFLTAKIKDEDRITGFQVGGDDYLCKPFNIEELTLRVRAILRRTRRQPFVPEIQAAAKRITSQEMRSPRRKTGQILPWASRKRCAAASGLW